LRLDQNQTATKHRLLIPTNMMFRWALVSALCSSASVLSFAPTSLQQPPTTSTRCNNKNILARFSTTSPSETDAAAVSTNVELTPEYQAALDQAKATVQSVLASTKPKLIEPLCHFCTEYLTASQNSYLKYKDEGSNPKAALQRILEGVQLGYKYGMLPDTKYTFGVTHDALRGDPDKENGNTLDYYEWGCEFFRYFMDKDESVVLGVENLYRAMEQANRGENVVFFANHQSEADPQVMSIMLEKAGYKKEAEEVIYVAGHKVTTDPLGECQNVPLVLERMHVVFIVISFRRTLSRGLCITSHSFLHGKKPHLYSFQKAH
jgi:hypothetical protein